MEENGAPFVQDAEVEGFRRHLLSTEARADFYEPITHPFPPDPDPETDALKVEQLQEQGLACDVPARLSPAPSPPQQQGDAEEEASSEAEAKRSVSQQIIDVAHRTAQEVTPERKASEESAIVELELIKNPSTKSIFNSLILAPSRVSSRLSRRESDTPSVGATTPGLSDVDQDVRRPRYYSNRATTLPAKLECKVFDPSAHPKLTRWEVLKRKFYLGAAHNLPSSRAVEEGGVDTPRASTAGPIDVDSFCEVTNIEGLDLEGIPPMTQRSRKLFSWTRLKTGLTGFKRNKAGGKGKIEEEGPTGEPTEATAQAQNEADELDDDGICSQPDEEVEEEEGGATSSKTPVKDKSHSWFEVLSHRIFTATRRQRTVEDAPSRPSTAHTQQYFEIESNW